MYKSWNVEIEDRIATVRLQTNDLNVMDMDSLFELKSLSKELENNNKVWVIILEGAGKHFSSGVNIEILNKAAEINAEEFKRHMREMQSCFTAFENIPKPTIAKIQGFCMGGGFMLAQCCDFKIASEKSVFSVPLVKLGLTVLMGTNRITRNAGIAATNEIVMLGDKFNPEKALQLNLLTKVVTPENFDDAVIQFANKFKSLPPQTISITKQIIKQGDKIPLDQSLELEIELQSKLLGSDDLKEALDSFTNRRKPVFTGN
ncbi:enoyl-CoA hydratase/isomerase family protein [Leptospira bourretii]|uniref:Enoyl-CoA hydratase/isomerase family protein n=1 Tax=Leptospira bourretii TaxID=2484962 RepID=A0A4R9IPQ8_9LEPT|nr:enoyl-CoA hydratase/isomerase family protein [Leptospira bourretii]TGK90103.1 enoyl-CoA hydratase/isomerase family protein [Leptospira bourretii]TGK93874.1 enoyl-CoA hydratase/isomerase family protein [Leptospira bourretii]TGL22879.1 enoyl-CoA hydratase/isomerase family protein [Leptospira bourretii]TGL29212.1 enoyl-CoA hydratase/isomerase family protein [Leptospira bourretii]